MLRRRRASVALASTRAALTPGRPASLNFGSLWGARLPPRSAKWIFIKLSAVGCAKTLIEGTFHLFSLGFSSGPCSSLFAVLPTSTAC